LLRSTGALQLPQDASSSRPSTNQSVFLRSFLVAVTNPKGYLFFSAFLPQFISAGEPQVPQYAVLAVVFAGIDFAVMFTYAAAGAKAIRLLKAKGVLWLDRACGGALLVLAGSLALYRKNA
jgi:threonine/homoserine/homoserine lactone efflux protein